MKTCSFPDCSKRSHARSMCNKHYERYRLHGDPSFALRKKSDHGDPERFYCSTVLTHEGDDCLFWPFARSDAGYAQMRRDGRTQTVARLVCHERNGPPPGPGYDSAHSCGRGQLGCVTKRHLTWKLPVDNAADRLQHGTLLRGTKNNQVTLSEEQVRQIRALEGQESQRKTAARFGVTQGTISNIRRGKTWGWLA